MKKKYILQSLICLENRGLELSQELYAIKKILKELLNEKEARSKKTLKAVQDIYGTIAA